LGFCGGVAAADIASKHDDSASQGANFATIVVLTATASPVFFRAD
jgi:hypothetical protein